MESRCRKWVACAPSHHDLAGHKMLKRGAMSPATQQPEERSIVLASNVAHSVHAARALADAGLLRMYYSPYLQADTKPRPRRIMSSVFGRRTYEQARNLPRKTQYAVDAVAKLAHWIPCARKHRPRAAFELTNALLRIRLEQGDRLHAHTGYFISAFEAAARLGVPIVADHRGAYPRNSSVPDPNARHLERAFSLADRIVVCSDLVKDQFIQHGYARNSISVIPPGVDLAKFHEGETSSLEKLSRREVLFVGRITVAKGVDSLLRASRELGRHYSVRLVGTDTERMIRSNKLPDNVIYDGSLSGAKLRSAYQRATILVLPSLSDSFGLVALEAMACGTPVIVTSDCGISKAVSQFEAGLVTPPRSSRELTAGVEQLTSTEWAYDRYRLNALTLARSHTWSAYGQLILRLHENNMQRGDEIVTNINRDH